MKVMELGAKFNGIIDNNDVSIYFNLTKFDH